MAFEFLGIKAGMAFPGHQQGSRAPWPAPTGQGCSLSEAGADVTGVEGVCSPQAVKVPRDWVTLGVSL